MNQKIVLNKLTSLWLGLGIKFQNSLYEQLQLSNIYKYILSIVWCLVLNIFYFSQGNSSHENGHVQKKVHVKKPLNAFMLYMKEMRSKVISECTLKESAAINQILGKRVSHFLALSFRFNCSKRVT